MNFPTICIWWGLARLPLWGRGWQGRNPETAETGSLRLEFPSRYSLSSETPSGSASLASSSGQPPLRSAPPPSQAPPSFARIQTHTAHGYPGLSTGPRPQRKESLTHLSHKLLETERGPLTFKAHTVTSCR